ncbi:MULTISPECIES: hypothetical protein [unclassified Mesorhizobium]|uniref:hypothetical protein n=1 Tax=unclassified Mesorhizobium TaxID=325217 RepID=UPI000FDAE417|nr:MULTISPECIES: hypothetical protein [unclassified Mesorhizobium]TGQ43821.1 hypothetical protein EN859_008645 [Mesorhizobium sp. M00.F.Ca.ET.216.01.1.1]TIS58588.1 MAG: hypothetical protein E5W91_08965 [Mesorhizobium sp.]TIS88958.1 MAG: hypothetical protein E5W89_18395 [Mesorhizobium sp.]TJW13665.1 MAG: hypothetical protein E5W82_13415 [Mesorhizobium sp.]TJW49159.1 MAG: hypothetical protein E5W83_00600 [Mesorhizobium sp.]
MADTITLTDHEAIRSWAAARAGFPAIVDVSPEAGTQAMLRLVFGQHAYQDVDEGERPVNAGGYELVEWDEWFKLFDERQLALIVAKDQPGRREQHHEFVRRAG